MCRATQHRQTLDYQLHVRCITAVRSPRRYLREMRWIAVVLALAPGVAVAPRALSAQEGAAAAALRAGVAPDNEGAGTVGLEFRTPSIGRLAFSVGVDRWFRSTGCDAIVGSRCAGGAWAGEGGLILDLAPKAQRVAPYAAARVGRLVPDSPDEAAVWNPSLAAGVVARVREVIGFIIEVRYSALVGSDPTPPRFADRGDRIFLQGGLRIAF